MLAAFLVNRRPGQSLTDYLDARVFAGADQVTVHPTEDDVTGFDAFMERYRAGLSIERAAVEHS